MEKRRSNIIVLDRLRKQMKKRQMDATVVSRIYKELDLLEKLQSLGKSSLSEYIKNQNGKKMKGADHIFKYRLSKGDRILYTYGEYLDYIRDEDRESLVIIAYAKHDDQGNIPLPAKKEYQLNGDIIPAFSDIELTEQDLRDMSMEEDSSFEEILSEQFTRFHTIYVYNGQDFGQTDPDAYDVYLSEEQSTYIDEYMKNQRPLLIIGGAGTGKTVMASHILSNYKIRNETSRCAYFTQSWELLQKIEKQYRYLSRLKRNLIGLAGADEDTVFLNINDYCMKRLGLQEKYFVKTDQFLGFVADHPEIKNKLEKAHIEPLDLWAEIRGTIKGSLDKDWNRYRPLKRQAFSGDIIKELDNAGLLEWQKNKQEFTLSATSCETGLLSSEASAVYKQLKSYFCSVDCIAYTIEFEQYLSLSQELSTLSKEHRKVAYEICQKYEAWLGKEKYDENDLVLKVLQQPDPLEKYDMVVVDEIQDYTELQIYLLHQLVKDDRLFIMSGDAHQNINPTVFSERRLHALIGKSILSQTLQQNFRCQKKIIECANGLSELRNRYIAKDKGDRWEFSERNGDIPIRLKYSRENERKLIEELIEYPDTAILVPTEQDKARLITVTKEISPEAPDIVFTVAEIKGMEYRYVVCFDLIGCYNNVWRQIFEGEARKETKYRYYFNLFYVGITRAQDYLCVMEPKDSGLFYEQLEEKSGIKFKQVEVFDIDSMLISKLTNSEEDWLEAARKLEEAGQYERAVQRYQKAGAPEKVIKACQIKGFMEKRDYESAAVLAIEIEDKEKAASLLPELDPNRGMYKILSTWLDISTFNRRNGFKDRTLSQLIDKSIAVDNQESIKKIFIELIANEFENSMSNILGEAK